jgi:hypothetical protein
MENGHEIWDWKCQEVLKVRLTEISKQRMSEVVRFEVFTTM